MATASALTILLICWAPFGSGFQLASLTSFFRTAPEGYDQSWDPEVTRSFTSEIAMDINSGCPYKDCSLKNGSYGITVANLTITDQPEQEHELHWMWSVIGHPAIQTAITGHGDRMTIDWSAIFGFGSLARAIDYVDPPIFTSAIMITRLIEFNDTDLSGKLGSKANRETARSYDLINFNWKRAIVENSSSRMAIELITGNYTGGQILGGKINLTLSGYSVDGFGRWLPHLSHSRKTNQFDIQLQDLETDSGYNCSRFAIELAMVSDNADFQEVEVTRQKTTTLDDEHTPGIFTTEELILPGVNETLKSYMQWRPIVYTTMSRELSSSTGIEVLEVADVEDASTTFKNTMLYAMYGMDLDEIVVKAVNVSFGVKGDGFFKKTNYSAWTFTFGTGAPIRNGLSSKIILTITVLVLVTVATIGVALGFCLANQAKLKKELEGERQANNDGTTSYQRLNDDQPSTSERAQEDGSN